MENVDQLFTNSPYHTYPHTQPHVYPFYSSPTHHQPPPPDPSRQSSPAPSSIPTTSSHGLFLQQSTVPDSSSTQEQHAEPPVDQIQDDPPIDEEPLYVNAKQYYRILKRRVARARLEEVHRLSRQRKPYLHESRHKHAMRRPRGPGGRFLTSEEIAAQKSSQVNVDDPSASTSQDGEDDEDQEMLGQVQQPQMDLASPIEELPPHPSTSISHREEATAVIMQGRPPIAPLLQPRPQIHIQTMQSVPKQEHSAPHSLPAQPASQHIPVQSPFDPHIPMPHSAGALDLLSAPYMAPSHPTTPTAISPHSAMSEVMPPVERLEQDHLSHGHHHHHSHSRTHAHHRHMSSATPTTGTGQSSPTSSTPGTTPGVALGGAVRHPYPSAMQMHHVPHPHAHARHHHSYLNRAEQLYASANSNAMNMRFDSNGDTRR